MGQSCRFLLLAGLMLAVTVPALSELRLYGGRYTEPDDWFGGAGYRLGLPLINIIPNAEYIFSSEYTYASLNADATLGVFVIGYVGGGVGINYIKPDGGDTATHGAINLIAGIELGAVPFSPFVQAKYAVLSGAEDTFVVSAGIHL